MINLHPPTTILIVVSVALTTLAIANDKPEATKFTQECEALAVALDLTIDSIRARETDQTITLSAEPKATVWAGNIDDILKGDKEFSREFANHPLLPFYRKLEVQADVSPVRACPKVIDAFKETRRIRVDYSDDPFPPFGDQISGTILLASLPALSPDGEEALISLQIQHRKYDGHDEELFLKKGVDHRWYIMSVQKIEHPPS